MVQTYLRVIPRDLFNESKLLKCIGRLVLLIHDSAGLGINFEHDGDSFNIQQQPSDGSLYINNIHFSAKGTPLFFANKYNGKDNYPMYCLTQDEDYLVFDENGNFDKDFKNYIKSL